MSGKSLPEDRWATVEVPVLVLDGGASPAFHHTAARALADLLPAPAATPWTARPTRSPPGSWSPR
jgi:hypothetical protein